MRYTIELNLETNLFMVLDSESQIVVTDEDGNKTKGDFVASFYTKAEAEKFLDRMTLRSAWGI